MQRKLPRISTAVSAHDHPPNQASSTNSPFSSQPSQQASSGQLQSRGRIASSATPHQPSSAAGLPAAQQGGASSSVGGGGSRIARASPALSQSASPSTSNHNSNYSRIIITQIFILLGTLNQEKEKSKRDTHIYQINEVLPPVPNLAWPPLFADSLPTR